MSNERLLTVLLAGFVLVIKGMFYWALIVTAAEYWLPEYF